MAQEKCNNPCYNWGLRTTKKGIEKHLQRVLVNPNLGEI